MFHNDDDDCDDYGLYILLRFISIIIIILFRENHLIKFNIQEQSINLRCNIETSQMSDKLLKLVFFSRLCI